MATGLVTVTLRVELDSPRNAYSDGGNIGDVEVALGQTGYLELGSGDVVRGELVAYRMERL